MDPNAVLNPYKLTDALALGLAELKDCTSGLDAYAKNNVLGFLTLATPNGSMLQRTMLPYAKHFVKSLHADRDPLDGIILLLDRHSSRWDLPALMYLYNNHVYPFFFPSHTSIWSQANDNGPNKRLHSLVEAEAAKRRSGSCISNSKFKPSDWNIIFRLSWHEFLNQERADYRVSASNTSTNAFLKTGIKPFNPRNCNRAAANVNRATMNRAAKHGMEHCMELQPSPSPPKS